MCNASGFNHYIPLAFLKNVVVFFYYDVETSCQGLVSFLKNYF